MPEKFPYELRSILNTTYIKVNVYPALIKVLGEEQVNDLMKEFYRIIEERKNWNTLLTLLEYGEAVINPILIERTGKSWIELLSEV